MKPSVETSQITACTMDCPDSCSLVLVTNRRGRIQIKGNPDHPITKGFVCKKIKRHMDRLGSPSRIVSPQLKRNGRWETITWEAALTLCAEKIESLRKTPTSILHVHGEGAKGVLKQASKLFFQKLGATRHKGSLCDAAGYMAYVKDFGSRKNSDIRELLNARRIVNWGKDPLRSSIHTAVLLREARQTGTWVITISPGGGDHDAISDEVVRIRPGTDRFLAAAVIKRLFHENRVPGALFDRVRHVESFKRVLANHSVENLSEMCEVGISDIDKIYQAYTDDGATATLVGAGLQRYRYGGENVRLINALAFFSGNIGRLGGGSFYHHHSRRNLNDTWATAASPIRRTFRKPMIAEDILNATDPPVNMIWVDGTNIVNQAPDSMAVIKAFEKVDFKVVVDAFMTDTALAADLVLPCTLMMEQEDITASYLHEFVQYAAAVVPPPKGVHSDHWILSEIGKRLSPPISIPTIEQCLEQSLDAPFLDVTLDGLRKKRFVRAKRPKVAYEKHFDHPDGKFSLPIQLHEEPPPPSSFPLRLLSFIRRETMHSQLLPESSINLPKIWISPKLADSFGFGAGESVDLVSPIGRLRVRVEMMNGLHTGAVLYRRGDWMRFRGGINQIISAGLTDMGTGAAYYDQYVRLEKVGEKVEGGS